MRLRQVTLAALLAVFAALWVAGREGDEPRRAAHKARRPAPEAADSTAELAQTGEPAPRATDPAAPAETGLGASAAPARLPVERARAPLALAVHDPAGRPVEGALVRASPCAGPTHDLLAFDDGRGPARSTTTDADGRALFPDLPLGGFWVQAERDGRRARARVVHEGAAEPAALVLDPSAAEARLAVRVVDSAGRPVPGALVRLHARARAGALDPEWAPAPAEGVAARADGTGTAFFDDPGYAGLVATAAAPDGRGGSATLWTEEAVSSAARRGGLVVLVGAPGELAGELRGLPAAELARARVQARLLDNAVPYYATQGAPPFEAPVVDGAYRFASLPAGVYTLSLADPGGARLALPPLAFGEAPLENSLDPLEVAIRPGDRAVQDLAVARGGALAGAVRAPDGAPVAGAVVRATLAPSTTNYPDGFSLRGANVWRFDAPSAAGAEHPESHRRATADGGGRYLLSGLQPGRHRVEVAAAGRRFEVLAEVSVAAGETVHLEHVLEPAGAIQGVRRFGTYLGVTRAGEERPRMVAILPRDGLFAFPGLEPGRYVLAAFHSDAAVEPVPLTAVDVEAGRTSWVDVDAVADVPVRVRGRVVDAAGPVKGARVRLYPQGETTGADGRFEFRSAFHVRIAPHVERGPLRLEFELGVTGPGADIWEGDLALGGEQLRLVARDALGLPSAARVSLQSLALDRPELSRVAAEVLDVPEQGELLLDGLPAGTYVLRAVFPDGSEAAVHTVLPQAGAAELRALASGELDVLVRAAGGAPAPDREVLALTWTGAGPAPDGLEPFFASSLRRTALTGPDGRALLRGVAAGTVRVQVFEVHGSFGRPSDPAPAQMLQLGPGERMSLAFDLPPANPR